MEMIVTKKEALSIMEKWANQPKRTYVRVAERVDSLHPVDGTDYTLHIRTRVYSKTWSKNFVTLVANGICHNIKTARKYLAD